MGWGLGRREIQEGGEVCMADLHFCTAETNTTLKSNYPLTKKKLPTLVTNTHIQTT